MVKQLILLVMFEDLFFHIFHRLLHCKWKYLPLYKLIHKTHHEFNETATISFAYAHPLEFVITNHYHMFFGCFILGKKLHIITYLLWGHLRICESVEAHSGYDLPIPIGVLFGNIYRLIPFLETPPSYHAYHHSKNVGNYSTFFTVWDTIFNSNKDYEEWVKS